MKKLKIAIVNQYAYGPDQSAGARHYWFARWLTAQGHDVTIVTSSFYHKARVDKRIEGDEKIKLDTLGGVKFAWIKTPAYQSNWIMRMWSMLAFSWRAGRLAPRLIEDVDIVLGSSPQPLAPLVAWWWAWRKNARFLLEIRDVWPESLVELGGVSSWNPAILFFKMCSDFALKKADYVISVLPNYANYLASRGLPFDKVRIVPNGVDLSDVGAVTPAPDDDVMRFYYAGAHGLYNGLDSVVQAVKLLEDRDVSGFRVVLIGDGPYKPKLIEMSNTLGLENLEFQDSVPKTEIFDVLKEASCFLMLLRDSTVFRWGISPNKLWDYFALGRPIIYAVNAANDPVQEANSGISIPPDDANALADAIEAMLARPKDEVVAMGQRARAYAEEFHGMDRLAAKIETICYDAIAKAENNTK